MAAQDVYTDLPPQLRRKVEEALYQRQMQGSLAQNALAPRPTQFTPQGIAVRQSPMEHLLRALTAGVHGYNARSARQEADDVLSSAATGRQSDMQSVQEALLGRPAQEVPGPQPGGAAVPLMREGAPADPRQAVQTALASQYPSVQGYGRDIQKTQNEARAAILKELLGRASPQSLTQMAQGQDPASVFQPKPHYLQSGEAVLEANQNQPGVTSLTPNRFENTTQNVAGVSVPARRDTFTGAEIPTAQTSLNATPQRIAEKAVFEQNLGTIKERAPAAQGVARSLGTLQSLSQELQGAYTSGSLAEQRIAINKFLSLFGKPPAEADQRAAYVNSLLKQLAGDDVKKLGYNPSNVDLKFIQEMVGSLETDPTALPRVLQRIYKMNATALAQYNGFVQRAQDSARSTMQAPDLNLEMYLQHSFEDPEPHPYTAFDKAIETQKAIQQGRTPQTPPAPLTPQEQARLEELKKKYGRQ